MTDKSIAKVKEFININQNNHETTWIISIDKEHYTISVHPDTYKGVPEEFIINLENDSELYTCQCFNNITWIGPFSLTEAIGFSYLLKNQLLIDKRDKYEIIHTRYINNSIIGKNKEDIYTDEIYDESKNENIIPKGAAIETDI